MYLIKSLISKVCVCMCVCVCVCVCVSMHWYMYHDLFIIETYVNLKKKSTYYLVLSNSSLALAIALKASSLPGARFLSG